MSFMLDTDMETQRKYYAMLKAMTPEQRLAEGMRLSRITRETAIAEIQTQHPEYGWPEVRKEYLRRIMTPEEFDVFYGEHATWKEPDTPEQKGKNLTIDDAEATN